MSVICSTFFLIGKILFCVTNAPAYHCKITQKMVVSSIGLGSVLLTDFLRFSFSFCVNVFFSAPSSKTFEWTQIRLDFDRIVLNFVIKWPWTCHLTGEDLELEYKNDLPSNQGFLTFFWFVAPLHSIQDIWWHP